MMTSEKIPSGDDSRRVVAPQSAGRVNDRTAMDLLLQHGPLTRAQLRTFTGMAQPTTAGLIERLRARGFVEAAGAAKDGRRGPNAQLYRIRPDSAYVAAAHISATERVVAIADITGTIVTQVRQSANDTVRPGDDVTAMLVAITADLGLSLSDVESVVVGTPGSIDPTTGDVGYVSEHPEWRGGIRAPLEHTIGRSVRLENRLNLAGIAEYEYGRGIGRRSLALLSVGPGTGMAIILDGQIWSGVTGGAGEVAYLPVPGVNAPRVDSRHKVSGGFGDLVEHYELSHEVTQSRLMAIARDVALAAAAVVAILDPGLIVLTGALGRDGGDDLAAAVAAALAEMSPWASEVLPTSLTGDAVLRGAIALALREVHESKWGPRNGWH